MSGGPVTRFRYANVLNGPAGPAGASGAAGPTGPAGPSSGGQSLMTLVNGLNSNITTAALLAQRVVGPTAVFSVGGFSLAGVAGGQALTIVNTTAQVMTIVHEDLSSTAANRIDTQSGLPIALPPRKGTATFTYDAISSRFVLQNTGFQAPRYIDVRDSGAKLDGTTDDTAAVLAADTAAQALHIAIFFPGTGKCKIASAVTIASDVEMGSNAMFTGGAVTLNGRVRAHPTQQIFDAGVTAELNATCAGEIWCEWWGAAPSAVASVNTAAIQAALTEFQRLLILKPATLAGSAPQLRLGVGVFTVAASGINAPVLNLKNIQGGVFRGCGTGQTVLCCDAAGTWVLQSPSSVFRATNCRYFEIRDMDILNGSSGTASLFTVAVAVGATTITINTTSGMPGTSGVPLATPIPVTLYKFAGAGGATWYEDVNITEWTGNVVTLDRPTRFAYSANTDGTLNYMIHGARFCLEFYSDTTDAGFTQASTQNRATNMQLGGLAITTSRYGLGITCNGGTGSASDINNDEHVFTNITAGIGPAVIGGVYLGHQEAVGETFIGCALGDPRCFYAIHAPQGGTAELHSVTMSACWALFGIGGISAHGWFVTGGLAEDFSTACILANTFIPNQDFVTAAFTQPAIGSTVNVSVKNSAWATSGFVAVGNGGYYSSTIVNATTLSLKNIGNAENALATVTIPAGSNIGCACEDLTFTMQGFNNIGGPAIRGFTASAAATTATLTFAGADAFTLFPGMPVVISNVDGTLREKNWIATVALNTGGSVCTVTLRNNLTNSHTVLSGGVYGYLSNTYMGVDVTGFAMNISAGAGSLAGISSNIPGNEVRISDINPNNDASVLNLFCLPGFAGVGWTLDRSIMNCFGAGFTASTQSAANYLNGGRIGFGAAMFQGTAPGSGNEPVGTLEGVDLVRAGPGLVTKFADGVSVPVRTVNASTDAITAADYIVNYLYNGSVAATLPLLSARPGMFRVRDSSGTTNTRTFTTTDGSLINGASSLVINKSLEAYEIDNDGSNWFAVISSAASSGVAGITSSNGTIGGTSTNPIIVYPVAQTQVFTASGNFNNESGQAMDVWVMGCGAGGGGGGGQSYTGTDAGGIGGAGGGGAIWSAAYRVTFLTGDTAVTIGSGGPGGAASTAGSPGGDSSVANLVFRGASGGGAALAASTASNTFGGAPFTVIGANQWNDSRSSLIGDDSTGNNFPGPVASQGGNGGQTAGSTGKHGMDGAVALEGAWHGGGGGTGGSGGTGGGGGGGGGGQGPGGTGGLGGVGGPASGSGAGGNGAQGGGYGAGGGGGGGAGAVTSAVGCIGATGKDGCIVIRWID
jgi:hypothetical protein